MNSRVYTQTARAVAAEQTATRIVDSMLVRFGALPYDQIRLEDVASDAGVTVQTVLRRFASKAGLMRAMVERELTRISTARHASTATEPADVIAELVTHYETYGSLILKVYDEARLVEGLAPAVAAGRAHHLSWCRQTFVGHLDSNADEVTRERRLAQVTAACDATTWRILRLDAALDQDQTRLAVVEMVTPLLTAPRR
ncbi:MULTISPECIES: TetR/AcrR family transcriptional regulator [unclassified Knoellia]|uniref:TetR/AcrR family transcriptional regulator n=1 Tax=Knoellia altitudinis TaxID=3404795 RepID=UPI003623E46B